MRRSIAPCVSSLWPCCRPAVVTKRPTRCSTRRVTRARDKVSTSPRFRDASDRRGGSTSFKAFDATYAKTSPTPASTGHRYPCRRNDFRGIVPCARRPYAGDTRRMYCDRQGDRRCRPGHVPGVECCVRVFSRRRARTIGNPSSPDLPAGPRCHELYRDVDLVRGVVDERTSCHRASTSSIRSSRSRRAATHLK